MDQGKRRDETIAGVAGVGMQPYVVLDIDFSPTEHDDASHFANFGLNWVARLKGAQDGV